MLKQEASYTTNQSSRLLKRLCKHFQHKVPAQWDEQAGKVEFVQGACQLLAEEDRLEFRIAASSDEDLLSIKKILEIHLQRMAREDQLALVWQPCE
ncbi:DUF2218 domain-containing protein [Marinospirillum perlucidum]|uniref:DUF2218 domain-containing protein n=1 Tax=Marinospirillum perlucidum TaxID=1982602 RepID=UPI000DF4B1C3|nr:DUF2218 domain-containing protein [Marinospirillum perlucidum]